MPNERDSFSALKYRDYNIAGNDLRVYSDTNNQIIFVVDLAVNETKPNVLLIIDSDNGRKWDDILENDWGVDLETVRPKKDNKYQKLDIEYSGLILYQELIDKYLAGEDINEALMTVNNFRQIAVRRAANERLVVAETMADNARETIEKTNDTINELNVRVRTLRAKLSDLRKNIGKEPTKQSASKILRTESQIDATNEKIKRAKKRLDNAQKRLIAATDDADTARDLLERIDDLTDTDLPAIIADTPIAALPDNKLVAVADAPLPVEYPNEPLLPVTNETKAEKMADEEVKPLFDTDPEILDEEIAFKPIDFNAPAVPDKPATPAVYDDAASVAPLSFTPPIMTEQFQEEINKTETTMPTSVLDSITSVETPVGMDVTETQTEFIPQPVVPMEPIAPATTSDVAPAPVDSGFRPVSPITGITPVATAENTPKRKQGVTYYILLIILIALSIFVLWFYQKSTGKNTLPNISDAVVAETTTPDIVSETASTTPVTTTEPEQIITPEPTPEAVAEPTPVVEPEPVMVEPVAPVVEPEPTPDPVVVEAESVPVMPTEVIVPVTAPVINTAPTVEPEPTPVIIESEEEILAKKPAYGVSQNEAMFVADSEFETDRLNTVEDIDTNETVAINMYDTPIVRVEEPTYIEEDIPACEGGASPDRFGCCPGESYTQIDNGGFVCCPDAGGDCFPPLF